MSHSITEQLNVATANAIESILTGVFIPAVIKYYKDEYGIEDTDNQTLMDVLSLTAAGPMVRGSHATVPGMNPPAKAKAKAKSQGAQGVNRCLYRKTRSGSDQCTTRRTNVESGAMCNSHAKSKQGILQMDAMREYYNTDDLSEIDTPLTVEEYSEFANRNKAVKAKPSLEKTGHDTSGVDVPDNDEIESRNRFADKRPTGNVVKFRTWTSPEDEKFLKYKKLIFKEIGDGKVCFGKVLGGEVSYKLTDSELSFLEEHDLQLCPELQRMFPTEEIVEEDHISADLGDQDDVGEEVEDNIDDDDF